MEFRSRTAQVGVRTQRKVYEMVQSCPSRSARRGLLGWMAAGFAVALSLWITAPAAAQNDSVREVVRREIQTTQQAIERAREHLAEVHCSSGDRLLGNATDLQRRAQSEFLGNTRSGNRQALLLTRQARDFVARAVQSCQVDVRAQDSIEKLFQNVDDLIQEARGRDDVQQDKQRLRLLEAGITQLEKAREAYRAGEFRRAARLATMSRNLVQRALQGSGLAGDGVVLSDQVASALERTDEVIAEARGKVSGASGSPEARALLQQAEQQQERARDLLQEGRPGVALRATELARTAAVEAMWQDDQTPQDLRVERAIEVVEDMLAELGADIRAAGDPDAMSLLEKAREQLDAARGHLADDRPVAAGRAVHLASSLLRRAAELAGVR